MRKRLLLLPALLALALGLAGGCHRQTAGAPPGAAGKGPDRLRRITPETLPAFRDAFNDAGGRLRYIAVFSPT